jgi:hypothetical protein
LWPNFVAKAAVFVKRPRRVVMSFIEGPWFIVKGITKLCWFIWLEMH